MQQILRNLIDSVIVEARGSLHHKTRVSQGLKSLDCIVSSKQPKDFDGLWINPTNGQVCRGGNVLHLFGDVWAGVPDLIEIEDTPVEPLTLVSEDKTSEAPATDIVETLVKASAPMTVTKKSNGRKK
jgi:hypothetical protein